jgi:tartrate dehydratase beta subunit/fumarate hydratase class I family protein
MADFNLKAPLKEADIRKIKLDDKIYYTGKIFHQGQHILGGSSLKVAEAYRTGKGDTLPFDMRGQSVMSGHGTYSEARKQWVYYGFSTAARMNRDVAHLIEDAEIRVVMGKGCIGISYMPGEKDISAELVKVMGKSGCIGVTGVGGCAITYGKFVKGQTKVYWPGKGQITEDYVENLGPLNVIMDTHGGSKSIAQMEDMRKILPKLYDQFGVDELTRQIYPMPI